MSDHDPAGVRRGPETAGATDSPAGPFSPEASEREMVDDDARAGVPARGRGEEFDLGGEGDDGYDSNEREYADDIDYTDDLGDGDADRMDYEQDDLKTRPGSGGTDNGAEEEEGGGGGALGVMSYLWMLIALGLFAYLIMKVQDQAATIKVLQRRVASLETRLGLQPMMPMEMQAAGQKT